MDKKGNFTLEIIASLIIILIIIESISIASEITSQKITKNVENENIEVLLNEFIDNLINNPGSYNWQDYGYGNVGLAIENEEGRIIPNSISYSKLIALKKNYKKLVFEKIFNKKIKTSIELIPKTSISSVKIGENFYTSKDIYSVNRLVKCDFYKKYVIKDFQRLGKCNHDHDPHSHSCNYFKLFKKNLKKSDYYLLIDDDVNYYTDTTQTKWELWRPTKNSIYLNDEIDVFNNQSSEIVFVHFDKKNVKAVLVSVPKNFDKSKLKYDYFITNDCKLILKAWY
mgnify:FL=1